MHESLNSASRALEVANQEQSLFVWITTALEIQGGVIIISPVYKTGLQLEVSMNMPYTFCCEHEQSR